MDISDNDQECLGILDLDWKARLGMESGSGQAAYDLYDMYGLKLGLSIRREPCARSKSISKITSSIIVFVNEGFRTKDK